MPKTPLRHLKPELFQDENEAPTLNMTVDETEPLLQNMDED